MDIGTVPSAKVSTLNLLFRFIFYVALLVQPVALFKKLSQFIEMQLVKKKNKNKTV